MSVLLVAALFAAAPLGEDQASALVFTAIRQIYPDEPLRCFSLVTEDRSRTSFTIAVRENHKRGCGGDPGVMPLRDRFRVSRAPVTLSKWDPVNDAYTRCRLTAARQPACPAR
jgi:hypothetical protein